jgi:hypothetical protein
MLPTPIVQLPPPYQTATAIAPGAMPATEYAKTSAVTLAQAQELGTGRLTEMGTLVGVWTVAVGGETSHVFSGLTSARRYRLVGNSSAGSGNVIYLHPNSSATNTTSTGVSTGASVAAWRDNGGWRIGLQYPDMAYYAEVFPRRAGTSLFKAEWNDAVGGRINASWYFGSGRTGTDFTSLQVLCIGAFGAGDIWQLFDVGSSS